MEKANPKKMQNFEKVQAKRRDTLKRATDILKGAAEIALYVFGDVRDRRIVYYLVEHERMPVIRIGRRIFARKSTLDRWLFSKKSGDISSDLANEETRRREY